MVAHLKALHATQSSFSQIASRLNAEFPMTRVTRNACIGKSKRVGLPDRVRQAQPRRERKERPAVVGTAKRIINFRAANVSIYEARIRAAEVEPLHVSLFDIKQGQCRYPYGDGPFTFCGCQAMKGSSYCEPHYHLTREDSRS